MTNDLTHAKSGGKAKRKNPPTTPKHPPKLQLEGWDKDALSVVAKQKIKDIREVSKPREQHAKWKEPLVYTLLQRIELYTELWFKCMVYLYQLEEQRLQEARWIKYWQRVGSLYKQPKTGLADHVIENARQYPIQDLLGEWRQSGSRIYAPCPFHEEKSPSFVIYPDNSWHCFGCGRHGWNAIDFLTQKEDIDFVEAVNRLR